MPKDVLIRLDRPIAEALKKICGITGRSLPKQANRFLESCVLLYTQSKWNENTNMPLSEGE